MEKPIAFSKPDILEGDINCVREILLSGWLTHGKYNSIFEGAFAEFVGVKHAIAVSNCTAALHLSCLAGKIGPGDEVIVPAQTHTATAHAVQYVGARPVFADVDIWRGTISVADLENKINNRTKAVIVVHMAGFSCDMDAIVALCQKYNLMLIEDCAHALGTMHGRRHVGTYGLTGCFSFYPTKQITTGEGGMIVTNDDDTATFLRAHRAFGIDKPPDSRKIPGIYDVTGLGYNYRMTDFQAALGYAQLLRYENSLEKRKANAIKYLEYLGDSGARLDFPKHEEGASYFLFQVFLPTSESRDRIILKLKEHAIGCSIHYAMPVPLMTYYRSLYGYTEADFPNSVTYGSRNISLPVHPYLRDDDIRMIVDVISAESKVG